MAEIHGALATIIPEPAKDRRAQQKLWESLNELIDAFETGVAALGGVATWTHKTKRGAAGVAATPPPAASIAPTADLVVVAEIGTAVAEAADRPPHPVTSAMGGGPRRAA